MSLTFDCRGIVSAYMKMPMPTNKKNYYRILDIFINILSVSSMHNYFFKPWVSEVICVEQLSKCNDAASQFFIFYFLGGRRAGSCLSHDLFTSI
jgi:hypothetical protein